MARLAVVLFNLGGPDSLEAVQPFLFNLFHDPAIIGVPQPIRWLLARLISHRRAPTAQEIYRHLGGKSPLLELTLAQSDALAIELSGSDDKVEVFVCMRYWHPMSDAVTGAVKAFCPDEIVLLPLYPQFSTTTVGSSLKDWHRSAAKAGLSVPTHAVCCYPTAQGWITAQADLISQALTEKPSGVRILFSAHGLPRKVVDDGDPYQWQVEQTAVAVVSALGGYDNWVVCYQSRVGPLEWIGPSTEEELARAAEEGLGVIIVPIAFVSEHSETLVELDIEYRELAADLGLSSYVRVPAVGTHPAFIGGLAETVRKVRADIGSIPFGGAEGARQCPSSFGKCPCSRAALQVTL